MRVVRVGWLFALVACGVPPSPGGNVPDGTSGAVCGNGMYETPPAFPESRELCDDGVLNGTAESSCTTECIRGTGAWQAFCPADVGIRVDRIADVSFPGTLGYGLAYASLGEDRGVQVVRDTRNHCEEGLSPPISLRISSAPVALGRVAVRDTGGPLPVWIEIPSGEERPHLYDALLGEAMQPEIHEIPYPFPRFQKPELLLSANTKPGLVLIDQDPRPPHDLLLASFVVRSADDIVTTTRQLPSPGASRGTVVDASGLWDKERGEFVHQFVQFFDEPGSFLRIETRVPHQDPWAVSSSYAFEEIGRGSWPFRVLAGDLWLERCLLDELVHAPPIAVLTEGGDVYVSQFSGPVVSEVIAPITHVHPGARFIGLERFDYVSGVWSLEPDGTAVRAADGGCRNLQSSALRQERRQLTSAWTTSVITPLALLIGGGPGPFFAVDSTLYLPR
ncbi:MAG: hypothetical protein KIT31_06050 [Deltaproteobacteria bacterium]|nr:hypothetical protein [Deltaproteobacteria bacterium]